MKYRNLILIFILFFLDPLFVKADMCDTTTLAKLKEVADHIQVTYEYVRSSDFDNDLYSVSIVGMDSNFFVVEDHSYRYDYSNDGSIVFETTKKEMILEIFSTFCDNKIRSIRLKFPQFNSYSTSSECKELESYHLDVCNEWYSEKLSYDQFYDHIFPYLKEEENDIRTDSFFYHYYFWGGIVVIVFIVVVGLVIVHRKRSDLE